MHWRMTWLIVLALAIVSSDVRGQESSRNNQESLKWAQGVGKEFLDAVASGEFEMADSFLSDSFRSAMTKAKKEGLREWLGKNAVNKALVKREVRSANISPDGNEVAISGIAWASETASHPFSLRLVKGKENGEWVVRYFTLNADAVATAGRPAAPPELERERPLSPPKIVKPYERLLGKIPADFVVSGVATYSSSQDAEVQITTDGHAAGLTEVVVNQPGKNVVLLLAAYDPTIWRISHTPDTRIVGVVASGYHDQALLGIDSNVKSVIIGQDSYDGVKPYSSQWDSESGYEKYFSRYSELTLGKPVSTVGRKQSGGRVVFGEVPAEKTKLVSDTSKKLEDLAVKGSLPQGKKGLDLLLKEGKIRPATQEDIDQWRDIAFKRNTNSSEKPGPYLSPDRTYVLLKETPLPYGLSGAHSSRFIVSRGVSIDQSSRQHCSFYLMDGTEQGPGTPR